MRAPISVGPVAAVLFGVGSVLPGVGTDSAGAAQSKQKPAATVSVQQAKAAISVAKAAVHYRLKDEESARWRTAKVAPHGNACIEVNAKNSYGAYAGFETYFFNARIREVVDNEGWMAGMWCRHYATMPKGWILVDASNRE